MPRRYDVTTDPKKLQDALTDLKSVYKDLPETTGCMEALAKSKEEGGCGAYCCEIQNPQLLYVEFINIWTRVMSDWPTEDTVALIERAVRHYLNKNVTKGCVFWNKDTKLCRIHNFRPFACRHYGIMPEEEWKPKYDRLKVVYPDADIRPQCGLVSTESGEPFSKDRSDKLWQDMLNIEKYIGIAEENINDKPYGSYRTFHDHIMLQLYSDKILIKLTKLRLRATEEEKEAFVQQLLQTLRDEQAKAEERKAKARAAEEARRAKEKEENVRDGDGDDK